MAPSSTSRQPTSPPVPQVFDRALYRLRRDRGARLGEDRFLRREAAEGLADRLGAVRRRFASALDLASSPESRLCLGPHAEQWTNLALTHHDGGQVIGDEEALPFGASQFDLVTSVLSLHAVNDLPGALLQIRNLLRPDGLFVAALFGGDTLHELRAAFATAELGLRNGLSPRVSPFADVRTLGNLLQRAGFALPVVDIERTTVNYSNFSTLVRDLRVMGEVNYLNARERRPLTRALLTAMLAHYGEAYGTQEGRLKASFDIVYMTAWAPHHSQPKPLRPGSAKNRLAEALGTIERQT